MAANSRVEEAFFVEMARTALAEPEGPDRDAFVASVVKDWADADPLSLATFALGRRSETERDGLLRILTERWARTDPQALEAWALGVSEEDLRFSVVEYMLQAMAESNPPRVLDLALGGNVLSGHGDSVAAALGAWVERDPVESLSRLGDALRRGSRLEGLASAICAGLAREDPEGALHLAGQAFEPGRDFDEARLSILNRWAEIEPEAALNWVDSLRRDGFYDRALEELDWAAARHGEGA